MTMTFTAGWNKVKLSAVPVLGPSATSKDKKNKAYVEKNNQLRLNGAIFLSLFNETDVRNAVQGAQAAFKHQATINKLLADMIGTTVDVVIDQGTHQEEDRSAGGFKLHFDARPPDHLCFHLYVGQETSGALKIIEISFMEKGGKKVEAHPS